MTRVNDSQGERPTVRVTVGRGDALETTDDRPFAADEGRTPPARGRDVLQAARATADGAAVVEVGSTGVDGIEPLVLVTRDGRTTYHPRQTADRTRALVERVDADGVDPDDAAWVVDHDSDPGGLPTPREGPLAVGTRRVLGRCGWATPGDGLDADESAARIARDDPEAALESLEHLGVLGRGRGDASRDEPVADDLAVVREAAGEPVVVVNANESDRRNATDRTLLGGAPAAVLDGALAVAEIVGAAPGDVVVYTNEADALARRRTREATDAITDALGGESDAATPQVVAGPDEYIAGEFTMALEALEGNDRLEARLRPPGPARHGLYGRPTVVHTPRTVAQVRRALLDPDAFDPAAADPGTRLLTVTGDVAAAATVELPTGSALATARDAVEPDGRVKMACVGGQFGGFTRSLDHAVRADALRGADLGTGGVVELFGADRCALALAGERARFASEANCGRCFPGREGSKQLLGLLRDIYDGTYEDDMIRELTRVMGGTSLCDVGRSAARSVETAHDRFETEFAAHADGRCPSGTCEVSSS